MGTTIGVFEKMGFPETPKSITSFRQFQKELLAIQAKGKGNTPICLNYIDIKSTQNNSQIYYMNNYELEYNKNNYPIGIILFITKDSIPTNANTILDCFKNERNIDKWSNPVANHIDHIAAIDLDNGNKFAISEFFENAFNIHIILNKWKK